MIKTWSMLLSGVALVACAAGGSYIENPVLPANVPITAGVVRTPGVTIAAADQSWAMLPGQPFESPFVVAMPGASTSTAVRTGDALRRWAPCVYNRFENDCIMLGGPRKAWRAFLTAGSQRVVVSVPDGGPPLHGLLYLGTAPADAAGQSGKRYQIHVPPAHVAEARGGQVAVIFGTAAVREIGFMRTWILWLFPGPPPGS